MDAHLGPDWYDWRGWRQGGPQGEVGREGGVEGATTMTVSLRGKEREAGVVVAAAAKGEQPEKAEQPEQKQQP